MPIYDFGCRDCDYKSEDIHQIADHDKWLKKLSSMKCPKCGGKLGQKFIHCCGLPTDEQRLTRTMRKRFKKRNDRIEAMPEGKKAWFKRFIKNRNIKKNA